MTVLLLTVVTAVPGQPFPFGTFGRPYDTDVVSAHDGQVVLASLCGYRHFGLIHGILLSCNLK